MVCNLEHILHSAKLTKFNKTITLEICSWKRSRSVWSCCASDVTFNSHTGACALVIFAEDSPRICSWHQRRSIWSCCALDITVSSYTGTCAWLVFAEDRLRVCSSTILECRLCSGIVFFFAEPRHNARFLKSLPVRERQSPWQLTREKRVHLAQVDGGSPC